MKTCNTTDDPHSNGDLPFAAKLSALAKFTVLLASLWLTGEAARAQCIPTNGLVSWWRAEGNATDSVGGNSGALINGAGTTPGQVGFAFSLDGQSSYVQVPDNPSLDPRSNSFTITAWIQTTNLSGTVVSKYDCGGACPSCVSASLYTLSLSDGWPVASIRNSNPGCLDAAALPPGDVLVADGTFHHLAMSRDMAAAQFRLYADGQLLTSTNLTIATGGDINNGDGESDPLLIGAVVQGGSQVRQWFFKGLIDEVRLFTRSLSDAEVESLYVAEGGRPRLRIAQAALTVTLRWPACAESFFLESAAALPASSWLKVTNAVLPEGDLLSATLPVEVDPQFYRLRKGN
jgi:Concanavalin A-like lectin/glucanases superfamily